jgi:outer membrane protein assembly factor BamB
VRRLAGLVLLLAATACGEGSVGVGSDEPRTVLQVRSAGTGDVRHAVELEPTAGATEPVLAGDVVLVTTSAGVTAFDLGTGTPRWTEPDQQLPAAVVDDVVVFDGPATVSARRTDGTQLWSRRTGASVPQTWEGQGVLLLDDGTPPDDRTCGSAASPCVPRPAATRGSVQLVDAVTGEPRWTRQLDCRPEPNVSTASTTHALVGCGSTDGSGRLTALRLADGTVDWTWTSDAALYGVEAAGPAVAVLLDDEARGLDPEDGRERWRASSGDTPLRGAPFVDSDGSEGFLRDPGTGRRSRGAVAFGYGLTAHDGVLLGADDTALRSVSASDGSERWSSPLVRGPRPITYLDADDDHVVSITSVGQEEYRD